MEVVVILQFSGPSQPMLSPRRAADSVVRGDPTLVEFMNHQKSLLPVRDIAVVYEYLAEIVESRNWKQLALVDMQDRVISQFMPTSACIARYESLVADVMQYFQQKGLLFLGPDPCKIEFRKRIWSVLMQRQKRIAREYCEIADSIYAVGESFVTECDEFYYEDLIAEVNKVCAKARLRFSGANNLFGMPGTLGLSF